MSPKSKMYLLACCTIGLALIACNKQSAPESSTKVEQSTKIEQIVKSVAVTALVEHPALDAIRDGVLKTLENNGYEQGKNLKWQYQSAQGNTATAGQIARKFIGDKPDVIVAIATPSAQAVIAGTKDIPVVFSAITDPVGAQLVPSWQASKTNVTGLSDMLELDKQVELIKQIDPNVKTVGMVYNPGEANSVYMVNSMEKALTKHDIKLVKAAAPRTIDVASAASSIANKVDLIYANTDNNIASAFESLAKVGNDTKTPIIAADSDNVKRGAVAALGIDYYDMGMQTGKLVLRILNGEKPGDIAIQTSDKIPLFLNLTAAKKQGVELSKQLIDSASEVIK